MNEWWIVIAVVTLGIVAVGLLIWFSRTSDTSSNDTPSNFKKDWNQSLVDQYAEAIQRKYDNMTPNNCLLHYEFVSCLREPIICKLIADTTAVTLPYELKYLDGTLPNIPGFEYMKHYYGEKGAWSPSFRMAFRLWMKAVVTPSPSEDFIKCVTDAAQAEYSPVDLFAAVSGECPDSRLPDIISKKISDCVKK